MRRILQHIAGMDLGVLSQGLDGWTDLRTVARGFGYVEKVKELAATDDLLAGVVDLRTYGLRGVESLRRFAPVLSGKDASTRSL